METEDEDDNNDNKMTFHEIRKSKIRMNQTLRKYFENAMSRILPQLLDDLYRDSIVEYVVEEMVECVEEELENENNEQRDGTDMETCDPIPKPKEDVIPVDENQNAETNLVQNEIEEQTKVQSMDSSVVETSPGKVLVDDEFKKVIEDEDGDIFVIKKKNLNQMPPESKASRSSDNDDDDEKDEDEKRRMLYVVTRRKFQILWVQFLKEFNSIFWAECFGFKLETPPDADWSIPDYAKVILTSELTEESPKKTLNQRWNEIPDCPESLTDAKDLHFRCIALEEVSDILYKKKVWKSKFFAAHLKSLWSIVSGAADAEPHEYDEHIETVRLKTFVPFERRLEFSGSLEVTFDLRDEIPPKGILGTQATMKLTDESYGLGGKGLRAKKLRFLTRIYERLAMKYVNVRVKQWLGSCSDFQTEPFNAAFKKYKRNRQGHPKWRKFKKKWKALGMVS